MRLNASPRLFQVSATSWGQGVGEKRRRLIEFFYF